MKPSVRWRRVCQECGFVQFPLAPENGAEFKPKWENLKCPKCKSVGSFDRGSPDSPEPEE